MIYYEVVHQVVVFASYFHNFLYLLIAAEAWRLRLVAFILFFFFARGACGALSVNSRSSYHLLGD